MQINNVLFVGKKSDYVTVHLKEKTLWIYFFFKLNILIIIFGVMDCFRLQDNISWRLSWDFCMLRNTLELCWLWIDCIWIICLCLICKILFCILFLIVFKSKQKVCFVTLSNFSTKNVARLLTFLEIKDFSWGYASGYSESPTHLKMFSQSVESLDCSMEGRNWSMM